MGYAHGNINHNIRDFGGDSSQVTLFGQSQGSTSVIYQAMYPGNVGLFHRAIAMSGSITSHWAFASNESASNRFDEFVTGVGCDNGTRTQKVDCLRKLSTNDIINFIDKDGFYQEPVFPSRDGYFIPKHPKEMLESTPDMASAHSFFQSVDLVMGTTSLDGG